MFRSKEFLSIAETTINDFCIDVEYEECLSNSYSKYANAIADHKSLLLSLLECTDLVEVKKRSDVFVHYCVSHEIPYLFIYSELLAINRNLMKSFASNDSLKEIKYLDLYFDSIEERITNAYFHKTLHQLALKNHLRLAHLSNLAEKNLMVYYQHHIEWMINLINYVENNKEDLKHPETNHMLCSFGRWLHNAEVTQITNDSHFKDICRLHRNLHELASDAIRQCKCNASKLKNIIHLMYRIDYVSLEIGNEIAILNDMIMIEEYAKDPLTGLLSRRLFDKVMISQIEITKATESQCSIMMCDLDYFKKINDTFGHIAGDMVIQNFAQVLRIILRKSDFIFRFGGEEFFVLLPSTNLDDAQKIAQKICNLAATQKLIFDSAVINYTVSIGVTALSTDSTSFVTKETIKEYVNLVDSRLYLAKQNGRCQVK